MNEKVFAIASELFPGQDPMTLTDEQRQECINYYYYWY